MVERRMNLKAWEGRINEIVTQAAYENQESRRQRLLLAWRSALAKEPNSLKPFQIDQIIREVRRRLVRK
jgi:hypothetical protein